MINPAISEFKVKLWSFEVKIKFHICIKLTLGLELQQQHCSFVLCLQVPKIIVNFECILNCIVTRPTANKSHYTCSCVKPLLTYNRTHLNEVELY